MNNLPKFKSVIPPAVVTLPTGTYVVCNGNWITVPKNTTAQEVQKNWVRDTVKKEHVPDSSFQVKNSKGNGFYTVSVNNGSWTCTCSGFGFRRGCKHISQIKTK